MSSGPTTARPTYSREVLWDLRVASPWVVLTLMVLSALLWWGGQRARPRSLSWLAGGLAGLVAVASIADSVNAHFDYLPRARDLVGVSAWQTVTLPSAGPVVRRAAVARQTADHPRVGSQGAVASLPVPGRVSRFGDYRALVWLPPQYFSEPHRRFPVLYLLHGSPGLPHDWLHGGQAAYAGLDAARHDNPVVIVMPQVSHSWLDDSECVDGRDGAAQAYLVADVVPTVDRLLRTRPDRAHRAIGGMSAGGFCALNVGLRHRDLFASIVDMSGDTVPTHAGGDRALFGTGPSAEHAARANDPQEYAPTLSPEPPTAVWMDVGSSDSAILRQMDALAPVLRSRGIPVRLGTRPGGHTFHVWAPALRAALAWLAPRVQP